jgi:hypothetical protein
MPEPQNRTLTQRDRACLLWIAMQYAIRLDQLQRLLYRHTPERDRYKLKPGTIMLSLDRTYDHINKWLELGFIEKKTILHGDKLWVWLSREGLRNLELKFNYGDGGPASVRLPHLYAINQVRLTIEEKRPNDTWQSERQIRRGNSAMHKGETRAHVPDGLLTNATNGKITAIEVERSSKNDDELLDDLRELAATYRSVWYFATASTKRKIESILADFSPEMAKPFVVYGLAEYTGGEYGLQ